VYRYIWDGHLLNHGVNPYALPVNAPALDGYDIPMRASVNHDWMASPYLPVFQVIFGLVAFLRPQSVTAFQVTAVIFDLLNGWLVVMLLRKVGLPGRTVLVYLWNPLVVVEFAHAAHVDAVMVLLILLAFWFISWDSQSDRVRLIGSGLALGAAALTKGIPILLAPVFWQRWGWKGRLAFLSMIAAGLAVFYPGAGLGAAGALDGTGLFGAVRIYLQYWNFNGGIYHWLEVWLSGYATPGAVPVEEVGEIPIELAKTITAGLLGGAVLAAAWLVRRAGNGDLIPPQRRTLNLLRAAVLPLSAYLLLTPTLHPWYVIAIIPLLPFLFERVAGRTVPSAFIWPWLYFSAAVVLSYLTYLDPNDLRELAWVRWVEYLPLYGLFGWALLRWNQPGENFEC
jgi:hypothetical protein